MTGNVRDIGLTYLAFVFKWIFHTKLNRLGGKMRHYLNLLSTRYENNQNNNSLNNGPISYIDIFYIPHMGGHTDQNVFLACVRLRPIRIMPNSLFKGYIT